MVDAFVERIQSHKLVADGVQVEVIYAEPDRVWRCHIDVPEGSTVAECVSIAAAQGQFAALGYERVLIRVYLVSSVVPDR